MVFIIVIPLIFIRILYYLYRKFLLSSQDVTGKIVLVTGASSGLGEGMFILIMFE